MAQTVSADHVRGAFRVELRAEAIGLAGRGWPVIPGTRVATETGAASYGAASYGAASYGAASDGEISRPVPVDPDWQDRDSANPDEVATRWSAYPYNLLVATGTVVDALEVDADLGKRAAQLLRRLGRPAPIVAMPDGRWLFLSRVAKRLPAELAQRDDVWWHTVGSWIPLPPTSLGTGVVHWRVKPTAWRWRLPSPEFVHTVLTAGMDHDPTVTLQRFRSAVSSAA